MKKRIALILTGTMLMGLYYLHAEIMRVQRKRMRKQKTVLKHLQMQITGLHLQ